MELWDAYTADFKKIDGMTLVRGEEESIPEGVYHLVCHVLVQHTDGTYLLMQRDARKAYPLMWEATAGGSALRGETAIESAFRELREETGIETDKIQKFKTYIATMGVESFDSHIPLNEPDELAIIRYDFSPLMKHAEVRFDTNWSTL